MYEWGNNFDYKIKEIETQFSEFHDKILMKELVEFCGIHDVFEYEVSVDMLKEALNLYIKAKENEKSGKDINVTTKWIPVSERLPEDGQMCLVTTKGFLGDIYCEISTYSNDLYKIDKFDFYDKKNVSGFYDYDGEDGFYEVTDITAWMPLPKPYKESEVE